MARLTVRRRPPLGVARRAGGPRQRRAARRSTDNRRGAPARRGDEPAGPARRVPSGDVVASRDVGASLLLPTNPVIGGGAGPRREGPPSSVVTERGLQYFVHAEQTIEIGGQRSARREVVSRALRTAELRVSVARAETRARVRAAYVGTQLALARVEAATQREALVDEAARRGQRARRERRVVERGSGAGAARARQRGARPRRRDAGRGRRAGAAAPAGRAAAGADAGAGARGGGAARARRGAGGVARARAGAARRAGGAVRRASTRSTPTSRGCGARRSPARRCSSTCSAICPGSSSSAAGSRSRFRCWRRQQGELAVARADRPRVEEERTLIERDVALEVERAFQAESGAARDDAAPRSRGAAGGGGGRDADDRGVAGRQVRPVPPAADLARRQRGAAPVSRDAGSALGIVDRARSRGGGAMKMSKDRLLVVILVPGAGRSSAAFALARPSAAETPAQRSVAAATDAGRGRWRSRRRRRRRTRSRRPRPS